MLRSCPNSTLLPLLLLTMLAHAAPGRAQDGSSSSGGGDPMTGDTQATDAPVGGSATGTSTGGTDTSLGGSQRFAADDPPPGGREAPEARTASASAPPEVQYGRRDPFMPLRLDAHVALTWEGAFGVGIRADFPLISGTFRYSNRDELAISVGSDITFISFNGSRTVEVFPTAVLQWSLGVSERTFLYPELGLVGHIDGGDWEGLHPNIGFGARYYLHRSLSLQGRLGWPMALSGGVTF